MATHKLYGDVSVTEDVSVTGDVNSGTFEGQTPFPIYLNPGSLTGKPAGLIVRTS